jgi:hypothetical protein
MTEVPHLGNEACLDNQNYANHCSEYPNNLSVIIFLFHVVNRVVKFFQETL